MLISNFIVEYDEILTYMAELFDEGGETQVNNLNLR